MSVETYRDPRHQGLRIRTEQERARAFLAAEQHSRIVRVLRFALPGLALLVLAAYFISTSMSVTVGNVTASISGVQVGNGMLRMTNPTLKGVDKKNGAYVISADYADQNVKTPDIIQLHAIKANMTSEGGGWSRVTAPRGTYRSDRQQLVLRDDIKIATSSGITGTMTLAYIDMKSQVLQSPNPVFFQTANGTVRSDKLTMHSATHQLVFSGHVHVHLTHSKPAPGQQAGGLAGTAPATPPAAAPAAQPSTQGRVRGVAAGALKAAAPPSASAGRVRVPGPAGGTP